MIFEFMICSCSNKIRLSGGDIIKCSKNLGRKLPFPIPFLSDNEVCIATRFNLKSKHVIPGTRIEVYRMYNCPHREEYGKEIIQHELFENYEDKKE
jgi:hypothetical protein